MYNNVRIEWIHAYRLLLCCCFDSNLKEKRERNDEARAGIGIGMVGQRGVLLGLGKEAKRKRDFMDGRYWQLENRMMEIPVTLISSDLSEENDYTLHLRTPLPLSFSLKN